MADLLVSDNIINALIQKRRMELNKHDFRLKILDSQERKALVMNERQRLSFLQEVKFKRKEWWKMDNFYRESIRKDLEKEN